MPASPVFRPMREPDVAPAHDLAVRAFEDLAHRRGEEPEPRPDAGAAHVRLRHVLRTDPPGAWVAEDAAGLAGCALALVRERVWGLSLLVVRPDAQSAGVGRELLRRVHEHARGTRGRVVLSSTDPRALRAYARLGLEAHPCLAAHGEPSDVAAPAGVRDGGPADLALTEHVDRRIRGAARGTDITALLAAGARMLVAPERGYAVVARGTVRTLAALDEAAAQDLLRAALARADGAATVEWLGARQNWALPVCLDAGLELRPGGGTIFLAGDTGPFAPYLPSGAYL